MALERERESDGIKRFYFLFLTGNWCKLIPLASPRFFFPFFQGEATKQAGSMAGLKVLRLVNEPTAAAVAYGYHQGETQMLRPK